MLGLGCRGSGHSGGPAVRRVPPRPGVDPPSPGCSTCCSSTSFARTPRRTAQHVSGPGQILDRAGARSEGRPVTRSLHAPLQRSPRTTAPGLPPGGGRPPPPECCGRPTLLSQPSRRRTLKHAHRAVPFPADCPAGRACVRSAGTSRDAATGNEQASIKVDDARGRSLPACSRQR